MRPMGLDFKIFTSDYRAAVYFGTFLRHQRALRIMVVVVAAAVIYTVGGLLTLWSLMYWPAYIAGAYLIWLIILFAQIERSILKYMKSENTLLGKPISVKVSEDSLVVDIRDLKVHYSFPVAQLFAVFETSKMFTLYFDHENTLLIPHHATDGKQRAELRSLFAQKLGDNFTTRFGPDNKPKGGTFGGGGGLFGGGGGPFGGRNRTRLHRD